MFTIATQIKSGYFIGGDNRRVHVRVEMVACPHSRASRGMPARRRPPDSWSTGDSEDNRLTVHGCERLNKIFKKGDWQQN